MTTIYLDHSIHTEPENSLFFKKIKQLGTNPANRIAILLNQPILQKMIDYLESSGLEITSNPKDATKPIFLTTKIENIYNQKNDTTPRNKGFTSLFIVDSIGQMPPHILSILMNDTNIHYLTTNKIFETVVPNLFLESVTYFVNLAAFHNFVVYRDLMLLLPDFASFLIELSKANLLDQNFYHPSWYLLFAKDKPIRLIKGNTPELEVLELTQKDIIKDTTSHTNSKMIALDRLDESIQKKETKTAQDSLKSILEEFRGLLNPVLSELSNLPKSMELQELKELIKQAIMTNEQIDNRLAHMETEVIMDNDDSEDILAAFRNR